MTPLTLLFQTSRRQVSNRAKFVTEEGSKKLILPTFVSIYGIPQTFWASTYKNTPFDFWVCNCEVDYRPQKNRKKLVIMPSFESCVR